MGLDAAASSRSDPGPPVALQSPSSSRSSSVSSSSETDSVSSDDSDIAEVRLLLQALPCFVSFFLYAAMMMSDASMMLCYQHLTDRQPSIFRPSGMAQSIDADHICAVRYPQHLGIYIINIIFCYPFQHCCFLYSHRQPRDVLCGWSMSGRLQYSVSQGESATGDILP